LIVGRTERFKRAAKKLSREDRARLDRALERFAQNPSHPSLGVKRIQGTDRIWEGRASDSLRFTFERIEAGIVLRNVGAHDETLKNP